jgi:hypothetical protein
MKSNCFRFKIDESVLHKGSALHAAFALRYLQSQAGIVKKQDAGKVVVYEEYAGQGKEEL